MMDGEKLKITDEMSMQRARMVDRLRDHYGITDQMVLDVMSRLPRHLFVPAAIRSQAYNDNALPISNGQTISQPFIVAKMTELLGVAPEFKVLEIGSGSGYHTAVLASLAKRVFAIERIEALARPAEKLLLSLGFDNFAMSVGDGTIGWSDHAPFDAIIAAAGGPVIPDELIKQLRIGGRLVMPVGERTGTQRLYRVTKTASDERVEDCGPCAFVPLIGRFGWDHSETSKDK